MWCAGYTQQQSNMPPCQRGGAFNAVRQCRTGTAPGMEQRSSCAQQQLISKTLSWCCHSPVLDIYVCLALFNQHLDLHSERSESRKIIFTMPAAGQGKQTVLLLMHGLHKIWCSAEKLSKCMVVRTTASKISREQRTGATPWNPPL